MTIIRSWLAVFGLALASVTVAATQSSQAPARSAADYLAYGPGAERCATWTAQRAGSSRRQTSVTWVFGFLSGAGWTSPHPQRRVEAPELVRSITAFCREHPELPLHKAAEALVLSLETQ
jgi:hypothetical protein